MVGRTGDASPLSPAVVTPLLTLEILKNMFADCLTCVKWNNVLSSIFQLNFGVRQGSVLSPELFAVYLDDLSNLFILERHKLVILRHTTITVSATASRG